MRSRSESRVRVALGLTLLAALGLGVACAPPRWSVPRDSGEPYDDGEYETRAAEARPASWPTRAAVRAPRRPEPEPGRIAVRLDALGSANALELEADGRPVTVERVGGEVATSTGRRGPWVTIEGGDDGVRAAGRLYRGDLVLGVDGESVVAFNHVDLEDYVRGVVASEIAIWSAPEALLEAQAIAARSYAMAQFRGRPGKLGRDALVDGTLDQAYAGEYLPSSTAAERVSARLASAVERTRGVVLTANGHVLDTRFHAACGGATASFAETFPEPDPGAMTPVPCAPCEDRAARGEPDVAWEWTADAAKLGELARALRVGTSVRSILPLRRDDYRRWIDVRVEGNAAHVIVSGTELRRHLGWTELKSALVTGIEPGPTQPIEGTLRFVGRGRGHGVGLCQTGARAMAEDGWSAERILTHYFPGARRARLTR